MTSMPSATITITLSVEDAEMLRDSCLGHGPQLPDLWCQRVIVAIDAGLPRVEPECRANPGGTCGPVIADGLCDWHHTHFIRRRGQLRGRLNRGESMPCTRCPTQQAVDIVDDARGWPVGLCERCVGRVDVDRSIVGKDRAL